MIASFLRVVSATAMGFGCINNSKGITIRAANEWNESSHRLTSNRICSLAHINLLDTLKPKKVDSWRRCEFPLKYQLLRWFAFYGLFQPHKLDFNWQFLKCNELTAWATVEQYKRQKVIQWNKYSFSHKQINETIKGFLEFSSWIRQIMIVAIIIPVVENGT